ncbi:MAG: hypothetical protein J5372_01325 [Lachnospiraceae bacterium]|nr:hypothetical protein [Lachnospiraceae bacterium]MBR4144143.1 hypothetical protein [Lachnospiraceae bacterium]MBR4780243.1 hypothetical protein [Lachnospiraceae bacterium]
MSKKTKIILLSVIAVLVVAVIILVAIEGFSGCSYSIKNNSNVNISSMRVVFESAEEDLEYAEMFNGGISAGKSVSGSFKPVEFDENGGDIGIYLTFEGSEEMFLFDGYFEGRFDGKVEMEFYVEEGELRLKSTASTGLFGNTDSTELDESVIIFTEDLSDWDYLEGSIDFSDLYLDEDEDDYDDYDDYDDIEFEDEEDED